MKKILVFLLGLCLCVGAWATTYNMSSNSNRPTCSGGWSVSGTTYTCGGTISLNPGDSIVPPSSITINGNISTGGGNGTIGLSNVSLSGNFSSSNDLTLTLTNSTVGGNVSSASGAVSITGGSVNGNVTNSGGNGIQLQGTIVGGNVTSTCCSITISGGSVGGNVSTTGGNGITLQSGANVTGSVSSNCCSVVVNASTVGGGVVSNGGNGPSITNGSTVSGGVSSSSSTVTISGSTVSGAISSKGGNGVQITNSTIPSGSIAASGVAISISGSTVGSSSSSVNVSGNNTVSIASSTTVYGDVTAANSPSSLTIDSSSTIYGVCTSSSNSVTSPSQYPRCVGATPLADWHMDEGGWSGVSGEVKDSSGNGYNGTAATVSNSSPTATTLGTTPLAYTNTSSGQSTCRYGQFDSTTTPVRSYTYVQLVTAPSLPAQFTFAGWIRTTNASDSGQRVLVNDDNQDGWGFSLGDGGTGMLRFFNRNISNSGSVSGGTNPSCGVFCIDTGNVISNNNWYFVAAVVDTSAKTVTVYVFNNSGTLLAKTSGSYSGTWANGTGATAIGGETAASSEGQSISFHFNGNIDELRVFGGALTQTSLQQQLTRVRTCAAIDHIEFVQGGSGLTCTGQQVVVLGCTGSTSCNGVTANQVSSNTTFQVALTPITGATWCYDAQCASPISSPVTLSNGSIIYLHENTAGTVTMGGSATQASNSTVQCTNTSNNTFNSTTACQSTFASSGLLVSSANQVSCTTQTITIQAVSSNNTSTACVPTFQNINRPLTLSLSYLNPNSGSQSATFNYYNANGQASPATPSVSTSSTIVSDMYWDANGKATLTNFKYPDVGLIKLNASATAPSGAVLTAISGNQIIEAPASFSFTSVPSGKVIAGANFNVTLQALNACSAITPNFGQESPAESASLGLGSRLAPSGTAASSGAPSDGVVSGAVTSWSAGIGQSTNASWTEVGQITLKASLKGGSYLGSGLSATGTSGTVPATPTPTSGASTYAGFVPAYFNTALTQGCNPGSPSLSNAFTYAGQSFAKVTVTALNQAGNTTVNYSGGLSAGLAACTVCSQATTLSNVDSTSSASSVGTLNGTALAASSYTNGVGTSTNTVNYTFVKPQTAPVSVTLRAIDTNGVSSLGQTEATTANTVIGTVYPGMRSGRAHILNTQGPELLDLNVPFSVEYWSGASGWLLTKDDICTGANATNLVSIALTLPSTNYTCVQDNGKPGESSAGCTGLASISQHQYADASTSGFAGNFNLWLKAPGTAGVVTVTTTVPAWLQFNWTGAVSSPVARATFGQIRSGPVIYRRELY